MMQINAKPVNFKLGEYISKGYEFLKNNFGGLFGAFLLTILMSIIPFCSFLAVGNFYKYCRDLRAGKQASAGDIFNFDDFMPYFILQLILIGGILLLYIPMIIMMPIMANNNGEPSTAMIFFIPYMIILYIALVIVCLKGFYMPAVISLGGVKDIKTAWNMSVTMGKGNLLSIFLFTIVISILAQLGILACGIGLLFTLPLLYTSHYFAFEDAMQQVTYDEIKEIGSKNEF
ncbi:MULTISPECIES: hypothetical protein [Chryseobacterium]|jgi:uncharacterized membrane protein|uniref:Membrane protein n=1 Tax=Chryseobacterium geocarposphaerae TaxID=1416776 RepID=A0ABU1LI14_9FLAO|nr:MULTISPECIES: hypothetical protein [Chryseobacterium]MDR6406364.1 putative membrane protein [Chryseobacterium geocarposphaerae]MDR6699197.1 putative membrane protein [Chryseobacterium ginsenosidimutans]